MNIEYTKVGDYLLPNLVIDNRKYEQINKYGYLRLDYIKKHILLPATEELEADDLQMSLYEREISFQINALYDGMEYTYNADENKVTVDYPMDRENTMMDAQEIIQVGKMVNFMEENKEVMKKFLLG